MPRNHPNWLNAFLEWTSHGEAPQKLYFWTGISTIAGALRQQVWLDQAYFKWYPNLYVILVAPPGVVSKSTTAALGMGLLKEVPGVHFGPEVVTMQALLDAFEERTEMFEFDGMHYPMSALTISSSEFGNLLSPQDKVMVDMLTNLWDNVGFKKRTRMHGEQVIKSPFLNIIACTTPSWIAENFPTYMIGGGFTSRCLFVYADQKAKYVAYPYLHVPKDFAERRARLVEDLEHISMLKGPFTITPDGIEWGEKWYLKFMKEDSRKIDEATLGGYINRKQTLIHKVAMCLSASARDELVLDASVLALAEKFITELEGDMPQVFARVGQNEEGAHSMRLLQFIRKHHKMPVLEAYRYMHRFFPKFEEFQKILLSLVEAKYVKLEHTPTGLQVEATSSDS